MIWTQVNPELWVADYCGWACTKRYEYSKGGKDHYHYVATKDGNKLETYSLEYFTSKLLTTNQLNLF